MAVPGSAGPLTAEPCTTFAGNVLGMVDASEVREFLASRRAKVTPEMVGLTSYDGTRRSVKGLRREGSRLLPGQRRVTVALLTR